MNKAIIFIITCILGIIIVVDYFLWKPTESQSEITITPSPQQNEQLDKKSLLNNPPPESIKGQITNLIGEVEWQSRAATEFEEITEPQQILQGEIVATKDGTVDISFNEDMLFSLQEDSELEFVQTLPDKLVLVHRNGTINYENNTSAPLSIRSSSLIALLSNGSMEITRDNEEQQIIITAIQGTVQIAYNNADFISQIVNLEEDETFLFYIEESDGEIL